MGGDLLDGAFVVLGGGGIVGAVVVDGGGVAAAVFAGVLVAAGVEVGGEGVVGLALFLLQAAEPEPVGALVGGELQAVLVGGDGGGGVGGGAVGFGEPEVGGGVGWVGAGGLLGEWDVVGVGGADGGQAGG